jgi:hypothetical protein
VGWRGCQVVAACAPVAPGGSGVVSGGAIPPNSTHCPCVAARWHLRLCTSDLFEWLSAAEYGCRGAARCQAPQSQHVLVSGIADEHVVFGVFWRGLH